MHFALPLSKLLPDLCHQIQTTSKCGSSIGSFSGYGNCISSINQTLFNPDFDHHNDIRLGWS